MNDVGRLDIVSEVDRVLDHEGNVADGLFSTGSTRLSPPAAHSAAEQIAQALGYVVSVGGIRSPQGVSAGMFSRRLAHVRVDFSVAPAADHRAAIICHELAHALDPGPYEFDHPWVKTAEEIVQAQHAQLVACLSSHAFTRGILGVDPGPGQMALAEHVFRALDHLDALDGLPRRNIGRRVELTVGVMASAMSAPAWLREPDHEIAVDRGAGVMWLAVGPAASGESPPSEAAAVAALHCTQARSRYADDPRFTVDLDTARSVR
ncbi:hypothetical protein [Streptomyces rubiginosohelvolus]|uniref:hypothetical protein n=1 Tax=Streptomyces rubiginosohelvolus TaxID=67362 RepID=UPI0036B9F537